MPECPSAASTIGPSMRCLPLAMNCIGSLTVARANWGRSVQPGGEPAVPRQLAQLLESREGTRSMVILCGITERETPLPSATGATLPLIATGRIIYYARDGS
jgi:hypothetical protein